MDQRCQRCINDSLEKKENKMDYEQAHLDSLNKVIRIQDELITFLKAEVERLKATKVGEPFPFYPGVVNPIYPGIIYPQEPNQVPSYPGYPVYPGYNPLSPPFTVTSTNGTDIIGGDVKGGPGPGTFATSTVTTTSGHITTPCTGYLSTHTDPASSCTQCSSTAKVDGPGISISKTTSGVNANYIGSFGGGGDKKERRFEC
jgi:hypothetical protein